MCDWMKFPENIEDQNDLKAAYTDLRAFVMDSVKKHKVCDSLLLNGCVCV
jgi:hypothetical protein